MKRCLLLQNLADFPSLSMERYAACLGDALPQVSPWQCEMPWVYPPGWIKRWAADKHASRWGRLVQYPRVIKRLQRELEPAVTHVLDHSHANLLKVCDPEKSVITVHDVIPMLSIVGDLDFAVGRAVKYTFPRKLRRIADCAKVIAISQSTKDQLLRFVDLPEDRVEVVHYGVSPEFSTTDDKAEHRGVLDKHGIAEGKRVVLHVCTRNRYKNTPTLLRALSRLPEEVVLLRVGAEMFDDEADLARDLGLNDRIIDAGRIEGDRSLASYYRAADVFAFPSTFEGFGWPPLEAMACGTPVVASTAASIPEVVDDAGLLNDPLDSEALADDIDRLLTDPSLYQAKREASMKRASRFTWETCAGKTADVYEQIASGAN